MIEREGRMTNMIIKMRTIWLLSKELVVLVRSTAVKLVAP